MDTAFGDFLVKFAPWVLVTASDELLRRVTRVRPGDHLVRSIACSRSCDAAIGGDAHVLSVWRWRRTHILRQPSFPPQGNELKRGSFSDVRNYCVGRCSPGN